MQNLIAEEQNFISTGDIEGNVYEVTFKISDGLASDTYGNMCFATFLPYPW